jgi:transcriptional regulator with XRE-family HTH domain
VTIGVTGTADDATDRRTQLGVALRNARKRAQLTQSAVAEQLKCGQGKINKIETTLVAIKPNDLEKMISLYQASGAEADQWRQLAAQDQLDGPKRRSRSNWAAFEQFSGLEPDATEILCWHSERLPGPLQSEHYMLQQHDPETLTSDDVLRLIRRRKARARIFTVDEPRLYRAVLSESSLHRMPFGGSPNLLIDQIEHLLKLTEDHEHVELHILPFDAPIRFVDTDFVILCFEGDQSDCSYIEYPAGSRLIEGREDVEKFREHWHRLRDAALSTEETTALLMKLVTKARAELHNG